MRGSGDQVLLKSELAPATPMLLWCTRERRTHNDGGVGVLRMAMTSNEGDFAPVPYVCTEPLHGNRDKLRRINRND